MALPFRSIFALSDPQAGVPGGASGLHRVDGTSLHAAIPEELRSATVSSAGTVEMELEGAVVDAVTGDVETRLAAVYRACPQFFARPVDETLDRPVRLRGVVAGGNPFASPLVSPIGLSADGAAKAEMPVAGSPFSLVSGSNPFAAVPEGGGVKEQAAAKPPLSPFLAAITGAEVSSAAPVAVNVSRERVGPPPLPGSAVPAGPTAEEGQVMLSFPLKMVLSGVDSSKLGIHPAALPDGWKTRLPLSVVKPQLASGQVVVTVARLLEGADAAAKTGLQGLPMDLEVDLPMKEVYRQLPSADGDKQEAAPVATGLAKSPFLEQVQEEATRGYVPLQVSPPVRLDPTLAASAAPASNPFAVAAASRAAGVMPAPKVAKAAPVVPQPDAPVESLDSLALPEELPAEPKAVAESRPEPQAVRPEPQPHPANAGERGGDRGWVRFDGVGFQPTLRDLELRAVFGRSEPFTRQLAVDLTAGLPGVKGCVLFSAETLGVLASAFPADGEARALAERTPKMFGRINGLAEDLGFESGETFTLRTSQGIVSFFRSGRCCLSVLHQDEPMEGGAWERLVLVARGVSALDA